jgi:UDP-xylose/UDP-N-acetylglucosamine transporter B4
VGIGFVTIASSAQKDLETLDYNTWLLGITYLIIALLLSSIMGLYQQVLYSKFGKAWREGLFYIHFLSLPGFFLFKDHIVDDVKR